jgi:Zn-dependent protease with chaperone function
MLFYLAFLLASLAAMAALWQFLLDLIPAQAISSLAGVVRGWSGAEGVPLELAAAVPLIALLGVYLFLVFGFLSRRCERQADLYSCRAVSFDAFVSALEKVAWLNGMSRDRPGRLSSWRHGSVGQRVAFLEQVRLAPRSEKRFQQETLAMKWVFLLGMCALVLLLGPERLLEQPAGGADGRRNDAANQIQSSRAE